MEPRFRIILAKVTLGCSGSVEIRLRTKSCSITFSALLTYSTVWISFPSLSAISADILSKSKAFLASPCSSAALLEQYDNTRASRQ